MEAPPATQPLKDKHFLSWGELIVWAFILVLLYFLSLGPVEKMQDKGIISSNNRFVSIFYAPWTWAYFHTLLHKPLGLYLDLWVPHFYDAIDETRSIPP